MIGVVHAFHLAGSTSTLHLPHSFLARAVSSPGVPLSFWLCSLYALVDFSGCSSDRLVSDVEVRQSQENPFNAHVSQ